MNDTIKDAVAGAGIREDLRERVTAYLESVAREATALAVQVYVDRVSERVSAGSVGERTGGMVLSAAFGPSWATATGSRYGSSYPGYGGSGGVLESYTMDVMTYAELGSVAGITDTSNTAWATSQDDVMPFVFVERATPDLTDVDRDILASDPSSDPEADDDEDDEENEDDDTDDDDDDEDEDE
jgi:hypothetical protein